MEIKTLRDGEISWSLTNVGKSCPCCEFLSYQICLLTLFANIKFLGKVLNLQYLNMTCPDTKSVKRPCHKG